MSHNLRFTSYWIKTLGTYINPQNSVDNFIFMTFLERRDASSRLVSRDEFVLDQMGANQSCGTCVVGKPTELGLNILLLALATSSSS